MGCEAAMASEHDVDILTEAGGGEKSLVAPDDGWRQRQNLRYCSYRFH